MDTIRTMEHLWAPWRMKYLKHVDDPVDCFFCRYLRAPARSDRRNLVLARGKQAFAILNRYPYTVGHLMIAPVAHGGDFQRLPPETLAEMMDLAQRMQQVLRRTLKPHGFNLGMNLGRVAGAGVLDHVHLHVVPRWNGDANFMPVVGGTKVHPMSLDDCWKKLRGDRRGS